MDEVKVRVPRLTDDAVKQLITDLCAGEIYTHHAVPDNLIPMVFLPLALGGLRNLSDPENIGCLYARMSDAGPRGINGHPIFYACNIVHKDDWSRVVEGVKKVEAARKAVLDAL